MILIFTLRVFFIYFETITNIKLYFYKEYCIYGANNKLSSNERGSNVCNSYRHSTCHNKQNTLKIS